jgi:hypothetical protein
MGWIVEQTLRGNFKVFRREGRDLKTVHLVKNLKELPKDVYELVKTYKIKSVKLKLGTQELEDCSFFNKK